MTLELLKGKIHRATVVQAELDYVGSITVDEALLEAAGILEYEKVQIVDVNNGSRFETYTISGQRGSGMICLLQDVSVPEIRLSSWLTDSIRRMKQKNTNLRLYS